MRLKRASNRLLRKVEQNQCDQGRKGLNKKYLAADRHRSENAGDDDTRQEKDTNMKTIKPAGQ